MMPGSLLSVFQSECVPEPVTGKNLGSSQSCFTFSVILMTNFLRSTCQRSSASSGTISRKTSKVSLEAWERAMTSVMWLWPVRMVSRWKLTRRSWLGRCLLINYITGIITSTPPTSTPTTSTSTTGALSLMRVQNSWISSNHSWMWSWGIPHNILTLIMRFRVPPILVQLQGSPNWPNYDRKWSLEKIWNGSIRLEGLMVWDRIKSKLGLVHCSPNLVHFINPICTRDFGSYMTRGGGGNGCNGWEVQKLSWNLISYQDWCQTWGFTTFRYLEPPQLMVWKSDFFKGSMRFVRVPPYES